MRFYGLPDLMKFHKQISHRQTNTRGRQDMAEICNEKLMEKSGMRNGQQVWEGDDL